MVSLTISKVRETDESTTANDQNLWPVPLTLWPEYFVAAVAAFSFLTSLCISNINVKAYSLVSVMTNLFIDKFSETKSRTGLLGNFGLNLILFISWIISLILFKVDSSTTFVWGFACAHSTLTNPLIDYPFICNREVPPSRPICILTTSDSNMGPFNPLRSGRIRHPSQLYIHFSPLPGLSG